MSNKKTEYRSIQLRASQGEEFVLSGRALTYNEISSNELAPGVRERIKPGCFTASLASGNEVHCLLNHDMSSLPLGRLGNGTLQIKDNQDFLAMRVQLNRNSQMHCDVYEAVKRGDISDMSFAFVTEDEDFEDDVYEGQRCKVRNLRKASLHDVSIVNSPFYGKGATTVAARSADAANLAKLDELNRIRALEIAQTIINDYRKLA
jgi:hypothetical protein